MAPHKLAVAVILAATLGSVVLSVLGPRLLGKATDIIFAGVIGRMLPSGGSVPEAISQLRQAGQDQMADMLSGMPGVVPGHGINFTSLARALVLVVAVYVLSYLLSWLQGVLTTRVVQSTMHRLRMQIQEKLARLPLAYFDSQPRGEILSRVTNDIDNLGQTLQQTLSQIISATLTVLGVLAMMLWISVPLALVAALMLPLAAVVTMAIAKRSGPQFTRQWKATGELNAHIEEMYTGHALVKVFGRQEAAQTEFDKRNEEIYESSFKAQFISGLIPPALNFVSNLTYVTIAVLGGLRVASGSMTLGDVQAFIQYSRQFTMPIGQIASMANLLQSGAASAERVYELLDAPDQRPDPVGAAPLGETCGDVAFTGVDFRYEQNRPLITNLDLRAEPGQTVAIVGHTGAGKTTLVNLLERFYEIDGGTITIDGVDITTVTRADLRSRIGMVLQDTWLFEGTIAQNIAYGKLGATEDDVYEAAKATYVDRFVRSLPDGYDTIIDEEGTNLSAGEKQLVTIARAFLADPEILVLDEATSSVDTRTEMHVQEAMRRLRVGRTSFVIAHRLSTIRDADVIVVMADGAIVETGTHDSLLAADGHYGKLYQSQFAAAAVDFD
jgi:ATP-binding cassette subfamily B multidrug efflux pump